MKKVITIISLSLLFITGIFAQKVEKIGVQSVKDPTTLLQDKVRSQQKTIDSLVNIIVAQKKGGVIIEDLDTKTEFDKDEIALGKLAMRLDRDLYNFVTTDGEDASISDILNFFAPHFSANIVKISLERQATVARLTRVEFEEELKKIELNRDIHYNLVNIDFLDTEIINDLANITYKTLTEYFEKDKHISNNTVLTTLTCRKIDRVWKIGSLSRTTIEYEPKENK